MQNASSSDPAVLAPGGEGKDESGFSRASRRLANSELGVGALSFGESTVVPIPLESILIPLMIAFPKRAWILATSALIGSILGASFFYLLGNLLFEPVVQPLLQRFALEQDYQNVVQQLSNGSEYFWAVFLISLGPAPLQLATLGAGASELSFLVFLVAIVLSRGIRYFGTAILCALLGERIRRYQLPKWVLLVGSLAFLAVCWLVFAAVM